jgi:hypothetical protein
MNILIIILLVLAGIIALLLIIALFTKKEYGVEREIAIDKPKKVVFDYLKLLKNQDNYSKWATIDPDMKKDYRGTDGTVGFVSAWDSEGKQVGKGEQTIKKISEGESIEFDLHFMRPFDSKATVRIVTEVITENSTRVRWGFNSFMKYPMNLMLLTMNMEKMLGDDFTTGLRNLKSILEK